MMTWRNVIYTFWSIWAKILSSSAHIIRYKNINELLKQGKIILKIDLKPALSNEKLDLRILRDFEKEKNKLFRNSLDELLPQKLIDPVIHLSGINPNKKVKGDIKIEVPPFLLFRLYFLKRMQLLKILKEFCITISGFRPVEEAIITAGGINIKEINPKTMESK